MTASRARSIALSGVLAVLLVAPAVPVPAAPTCTGDCGDDARVSAADLLSMVAGLAAGSASVCPAADADEDGLVAEEEITRAITNIFGRCAIQPASYGSLDDDLYSIAFPAHVITTTQVAAILRELEALGALTEAEIRALLPELLAAQGVHVEHIGAIGIETQRQNEQDCEECIATCAGTCVQSPRGDCFCFETLPTEPSPPLGGRIVVLLLEKAEDEAAARKPLVGNCRDLTRQGGVDDQFSPANGSEPASPSQGLATHIQQSTNRPPAPFDGTTIDRVFGHTFLLPPRRCIDRARLQLRARPIPFFSSTDQLNDSISLFFMPTAGQTAGASWAAYFGTGNSGLPSLVPHPWTPAGYPTGALLSLDLANLPGGVNLLPDLNAMRSLDVFVQDDSAVDFVRLLLRYCDCPPPTPTFTPRQISTPTRTRTTTPPPTSTLTRPPTVTATATPTSTNTLTATVTATPTTTRTATETATPTRTPMCVAPPPDMVAWWPMDESTGATELEDIVDGNQAAVSLSPLGAAQAPQAVPGVVGGAVHFAKDGSGASSSFVSQFNPGLLFAGSADLTIDAWVRFPPAAAGVPHYVVNRFDTTQNRGYALYVVSPTTAGNERLEFLWGDGTNTGTVQTSAPLPANQWYHVAVTLARNVGGNALDIRLYVDAVQQGQFAGSPPALASLSNFLFLYIGAQPGTVDRDIAIDELEIFSRALAPPEIQGIFDAGSAGKCKPETPTPTPTPTFVTPTPAPCSMTICKQTNPAGGTGFGFHSAALFQNVTLNDGQCETRSPQCGPIYDVYEILQPGSVLANISCTFSGGTGIANILGATVNPTSGFEAGDNTVIFSSLSPGTSLLCTFTNIVSTPTSTATATITHTVPTATPSASPTTTSSATASNTPTRSATPSPTATNTPTPTCVIAPGGMVAWWPLDESAGSTTVVDFGLPPANHGAPKPTEIVVFPPDGPMTVAGNLFTNPADTAFFFWGDDIFVEVPHSGDLDLANSDLTIDAWVGLLPGPWVAGRDDLHVYPIVDKLDLSGSGYAFYVEVETLCPTCPPPGQPIPPSGVSSTTDIRLVFVVGNGGGLNLYESLPIFSGGGTLFPFPTPATALNPQPPGWLHATVTVDRGQSTGRFYHDGVHVLTVNSTPDFFPAPGANNTVPVWLGGTRLYGTVWAPGFSEFTLNEIEIFDATLGAADVLSIAGAAGKCKPTPAPPTPTPTSSPTSTATRTQTRTPTRPNATATSSSTLTRTATRTPTPACFTEVCVFKFSDSNQNGVLDAGEALLPGWTIEFRDQGGTLVASIVTGVGGGFCTAVPAPAAYTVSEVTQAGWIQTFPPPPGAHNVMLTCGTLTDLYFGNVQIDPHTPTLTPTQIPTPTSTATRTRTHTPVFFPPPD